MPDLGDSLYLLNAGETYYQGADRYSSNPKDFYDLVRTLLPSSWNLMRESIWMHCSRPEIRSVLPVQGWKIHLSVRSDRACDLLQRVVPELAARDTPFKFALDKRILYLLNSKYWGRGGSGKFVTIYPLTDHAFVELADCLSALTEGMEGPYILSDRRYRGSKVVFYRYGGFQQLTRFDSAGGHINHIIAPDGQWVEDIRHPYFQVPEWLTDPYAESDPPENDSEADSTLQSGRFRIDDVLQFTNAGGVYVGVDTLDGRKILIKEARPFVYAFGTESYATDMLAREHEMLSRLADLDVEIGRAHV